MSDWFEIAEVESIPTPSLAFYPDRVRENIRRMIAICGGTARLRPHVKTHKTAQVVLLQIQAGITKFKCATLAEAQMLAHLGAGDVLLAYAPVGPNIGLLRDLVEAHPGTRFSALADDAAALRRLAEAMEPAREPLAVYVDIDDGMGRTGVRPDARAVELYQLLCRLSGVRAAGLHVYDGQVRDADLAQRTRNCDSAFAVVQRLVDELKDSGMPVPAIVAGGTPTFPIHARRAGVECSPGTCVLWDANYSERYADLDFLHAAVLLTRIVSKPGPDRLTLDLGYKAVSADAAAPRVRLFGLPDAKAEIHSEEHLTIASAHAAKYSVGDMLYGIPLHICPTVALHAEAHVVEGGHLAGTWKIAARDRAMLGYRAARLVNTSAPTSSAAATI